MEGIKQEVGSVKQFYGLMMHFDNNNNVDHDWKRIWRLRVPERIKTFVWMLKHDRLLTNQSNSRKGLAIACNLCGHANESTLHVFRDCPCTWEIWMNSVPLSIQYDFFNVELEEWFSLNINHSNKEEA